MGCDDVDIWVIERFGRNATQRFAIDDEMVFVESLDIGRDFASPGWRWQDFVSGFPAKYCGIVAVFDASVGVFSCEKMPDSRFEIVDDLRFGPKVVSLFAAKGGIFTDTAPPFSLIDEGNDDANSFATGHFDHFVE